MKRLTVQLIIAILLTMSGIVLLFSGFWIDPALEEFTYSCIAVENALDNTPPAAAKTALNHLVTYLLEPLRKFYKSPVAILSGYRSDAVNRLAGGVVASQHRKGEALIVMWQRDRSNYWQLCKTPASLSTRLSYTNAAVSCIFP